MMRSIAIAGVIAMFTMFFTAAAGAAVPVATADEIVALKKSEPKNILVLDVRTPGEFADGRVPGSVLIPMRDVPSSLGRIDKSKKIVVVCATGARSGAVADYLIKNGYPWVKNYAGGMMDWSRRGLSIEK